MLVSCNLGKSALKTLHGFQIFLSYCLILSYLTFLCFHRILHERDSIMWKKMVTYMDGRTERFRQPIKTNHYLNYFKSRLRRSENNLKPGLFFHFFQIFCQNKCTHLTTCNLILSLSIKKYLHASSRINPLQASPFTLKINK